MAKKSATAAAASEAVSYGALLESNGETLRAMMRAHEAILDGMAALSREIVEFGSARLRHDVEASESLMQCKDMEEAFRKQCDFARSATQQYFEEANKLMSLAAKVTQDCWAPLEDRTKAALHDINGK